MNETELDSQKVRMKSDGRLVIRVDGKEVEVAKYDKTTGALEFATKEYSVKYYQQVTARIGSTNQGTEVSGNVIRSMRVKGDAIVAPKTKRPKLGPDGDAAEDIVQWYLDNDLPQAIVRYGIYVDDKGVPVRKHVKRVVKNTIDMRNLDDDDISAVKEGPKTQTKAPVFIEPELIEDKKGIIARRGTRLTFTPNEVVGGYSPDEEYDEVPPKSEESE